MERALRRELIQSRLLFPAVAKEAIRRVFDDQKPVAGGKLGDSLAFRARARRARRILKIGNDVEELRHLLLERALERLDIRAVRFERNAHERRAVAAKEADGAVVGRPLGEDDVAGANHVQAEKLDDLQ